RRARRRSRCRRPADLRSSSRRYARFVQELIASHISTLTAAMTPTIAPAIHHIEPVAKTRATNAAATRHGAPNQSIQRYISCSATSAGEGATTSRAGRDATYSGAATALISLLLFCVGRSQVRRNAV